jgi:hypothetical protein
MFDQHLNRLGNEPLALGRSPLVLRKPSEAPAWRFRHPYAELQ